MKKVGLSLAFNILIFVFVLIATIFMYAGIEFMGHSTLLVADSVKMIQFYTVQSNLLIGIMSGIFIVYEILILTKRINNIPNVLYLLKLIFTIGVSITLFVVIFYLTPATGANAISLYTNSNLFYHLLVPVLAIITFVCFEKTDGIKFNQLIYGIIPTILYGIYYGINAYSHIENGKIDYAYDWYGFAQNGILATIIVFIFILGFAYLFSFLLWKLNRHKNS